MFAATRERASTDPRKRAFLQRFVRCMFRSVISRPRHITAAPVRAKTMARPTAVLVDRPADGDTAPAASERDPVVTLCALHAVRRATAFGPAWRSRDLSGLRAPAFPKCPWSVRTLGPFAAFFACARAAPKPLAGGGFDNLESRSPAPASSPSWCGEVIVVNFACFALDAAATASPPYARVRVREQE